MTNLRTVFAFLACAALSACSDNLSSKGQLIECDTTTNTCQPTDSTTPSGPNACVDIDEDGDGDDHDEEDEADDSNVSSVTGDTDDDDDGVSDADDADDDNDGIDDDDDCDEVEGGDDDDSGDGV